MYPGAHCCSISQQRWLKFYLFLFYLESFSVIASDIIWEPSNPLKSSFYTGGIAHQTTSTHSVIKDKPLAKCLLTAFLYSPRGSSSIKMMSSLICVRVLINADSVSTLMEPLWIQTHTTTGLAVKSNISDLPDKFSLAQSKHIWLQSGSWGGRGHSALLSLTVRT